MASRIRIVVTPEGKVVESKLPEPKPTAAPKPEPKLYTGLYL